MNKLRITLVIISSAFASAQAIGDEVLNLKLDCEGELWVLNQNSRSEQKWTDSFHIRNNILVRDGVKLKVFDHAIVAVESPKDISGYAFSLGRLDGKLTYTWNTPDNKSRFNFQAECRIAEVKEKLF